MSEEEIAELMEERRRRYENALLGAKEIVARLNANSQPLATTEERTGYDEIETGVDQETLNQIAQTITTVPRDFNLNPKVVGMLARRAKMVAGSAPVDWGLAEALAFGSLLLEGTGVRLTGQDTVRGTFSHRHAAFADTTSGTEWAPLATLGGGRAKFQVYDSPLSEGGALGFEYGYSVAAPESLVLWEAQFGDFVNAAQVIIDQFIASGEEKWNQRSRVVLLLPHGYEGQGPEHSSARFERFLQLCAGDNMQVVNCSTAAQYFHVLRRQARQPAGRPLLVLTPKSLLRFAEASSPIAEFTTGSFQHVLGDSDVSPAAATRVLLCSGKVYYDLAAERRAANDQQAAIIRVEQLYPFPADLGSILGRYSNASDVCWVQEEPRNMGAWSFVEPRLLRLLSKGQTLRYAGREESSSTATGSHTIHQIEQKRLIRQAFGRDSESEEVE
jgi:2-oxoglutarate dehydrogenase E1 component